MIKVNDIVQSHTMRQLGTTNRSSDSGVEEQLEAIPTDEDPKDNEEEAMENKQAKAKWMEHSFIKPLRVLGEHTGFSNLSCMYKNLSSLAVTSCSAERTMSRVKMVKDRIRTRC